MTTVIHKLVESYAALPGSLAGWDRGGWGRSGWGGSLWFVVVPLLVALTVAAVFMLSRRRSTHARASESVLEERFARGEISEEEYRARLAVLRETTRT
ncbi:SHOCT domain-containing protein [Streptosporangium soli]|nr:SHOCT domain-containing protein [Streptosporangium sp. KLBMP 9127]